MKYTCDYTNDLLEIDADCSVKEKLIEEIERTILLYENNKFCCDEQDKVYDNFNKKIDECISLLKNKIELVRSGKHCENRVTLNECEYVLCLIK